MWYEDGTSCDYFGPVAAKVLLAAGWLETDHKFTTEQVDPGVVTKIQTLLKQQPGFDLGPVFMGPHQCSICSKGQSVMGSSNLFVPDHNRIWVCPELIQHYITGHRYFPPMAFQQAVLACPDRDTKAYEKAVQLAGGKQIDDPGNYSDSA